MSAGTIAQAVWQYTRRTLVAGVADPPATRAQEIAKAIWEYAARTLTTVVAVGVGADVLRFDPVSMRAIGTVPGVAVLRAAAANGPGRGMLDWNGRTLRWRAPGSATFGRGVPGVDGERLLVDGQDAAKWVRVQIAAAHLLATPAGAGVYLADTWNNGISGEDVDAAGAAAGTAESWTVIARNAGLGWLSHVRAWLDPGELPAGAALELSADGGTWSAPVDEASAIGLPDLAPFAQISLHLRRSIAAGTLPAADALHHLVISFDGR